VERFFRTLAELSRRWAEFFLPRDDSDHGRLGLRGDVQEFHPIAENISERTRGKRSTSKGGK